MATGLALVEAFNEWHWASNCFHDHVVRFALKHRDDLTSSPGGEHSHLAHQLHEQFKEQLEGFVQSFLEHHGTTMEAFEAALQDNKDTGDLCTRMSIEVVVDELFSLLEYDAFHRTMLQALAHESSAGEEPRAAEAREALQAFVEADVPEARAVVQALSEQRHKSEELYADSPAERLQ
ncbi:unnamed protein product, partial [Polarella glacialis]